MTVSERDRKILVLIVPVALIAAFWFLLLAPKRAEVVTAEQARETQQQKHDSAAARAAQAESAKRSFATDYAGVLELGKAVPATPDMPTVLVQLERAARGTGIDFGAVTVGTRVPAAAAPAAGATPPKGSAPPAGGATPASSAAAGAPGAAAASAGGAGVPGLDSVPMELKFDGSFFDLADFMHRAKRFVVVANRRIEVRGRLLEIEGLRFDSSRFPQLKATLRATVYLSPQAQAQAGAGAAKGGTPAPAAPGAAPAATPAPAPPTGGTPPAATVSR